MTFKLTMGKRRPLCECGQPLYGVYINYQKEGDVQKHCRVNIRICLKCEKLVKEV